METHQSDPHYFQALAKHLSSLVWQSMATSLLPVQQPKTRLEEHISVVFMSETSGTTELLWRTVNSALHRGVPEHGCTCYFSFSSLQLFSSVFQMHTEGCVRVCVLFGCISSFDIFTFAYFYPSVGIHAEDLQSQTTFSSCHCCYMLSVALQLCGCFCQSISIFIQISMIRAD